MRQRGSGRESRGATATPSSAMKGKDEQIGSKLPSLILQPAVHTSSISQLSSPSPCCIPGALRPPCPVQTDVFPPRHPQRPNHGGANTRGALSLDPSSAWYPHRRPQLFPTWIFSASQQYTSFSINLPSQCAYYLSSALLNSPMCFETQLAEKALRKIKLYLLF